MREIYPLSTVQQSDFHVNLVWIEKHDFTYVLILISCKNNVMPSDFNITRLKRIVDIIKNPTGGQRTIRNVTLVHPVICYSIYH